MSLNWYHNWHKHPRHQHAHWLVFVSLTLAIFSYISADIWSPSDNINIVNAQVASNLNFKGDLMLWVPPLALNCDASGVDPRNNFHCSGDIGVPNGLIAGWVWGITAPWYTSSSDREMIYQAALSQGHTHFAVHISTCVVGDFYHQVVTHTSGECADWANRLNTVLAEIKAHGMTTLCMGTSASAPPQPGLNKSLCDVVGDDWDNTSQKDCNLQAMATAFPNSPLFVEVQTGILPQPDSCTPPGLLPSSNGSAWISSVKQRFPNFKGMFHETGHDGVSQDIQVISNQHTFWNGNAQEVLFETDTFPKFWQNLGLAESITYNNSILSGLSYLCGFFSGASINSQCAGGTQPPPPPSSGPPPPPGSGTSARYIYFVTPNSVPAGDSLTISGQNLSVVVNFYNSSGAVTTTSGAINRDRSEVTVTVPPGLVAGKYQVNIGSSPDSNKFDVTILAPVSEPVAQSGSDPNPCSSATDTSYLAICDFAPGTVGPGDEVYFTGAHLTGAKLSLTNSSRQETNVPVTIYSEGYGSFVVPSNLAEGAYTVGLSNDSGNTSAAKQLYVTQNPPPAVDEPPSQPNPPLTPSIKTPPLPPATNFQQLISNAFNYSIALVGIAVFIMVMWGGFLWLTSAANPGNIASAKRYITNALLGAVLLVSAYVILYTINPELVGGGFSLEGILPPAKSTSTTTRYVATSEAGAASAIDGGCTVNIDSRDYTAVECEPDFAGGPDLIIDPVLTTTDSATDDRIGATTLQSSGNTGTGRKIVILDTGYNYNNPDLRSSYIGGKDFVNGDDDPMDDNTTGKSAPGHGSHVAGIITGDGIDARAKGVAPGAGIISGKVLGSDGGGNWSNLMRGIYWAVDGPDGIFGTTDDFKPDAINISVGGGSYGNYCDNNDETSRLMAKALQYARDNGVLPIIAAGNTSTGVSLPGCIEAAFTVGNVDSSDRISNSSGRGVAVDIVAPGVNIYSTLLGSNYGIKSGTSMATPVVSGVVALFKSANPSLTVSELENQLTSTACDLGTTGKDSLFGWGRVSASPGSCTPPPPVQRTGISGIVRSTPSSCTKGASVANPNCDLNISYSLTGITSATQVVVGKDGNFLQNIQCNSTPCSGQISDPDPNAGVHKYEFRVFNSVVAFGNSYIFTTGNVTASFGSCAIGNASNPNCNVTLTVTAPGIYPNSVLVTKDGSNWRLMPCPNSSCSISITDSSPSAGTHTYTISDASDNTGGRLKRVSVNITSPASPVCNAQTSEVIELCTGANYTGTCGRFNCQEMANFNGTSIAGQQINSARIISAGSGVSDARIYTCNDSGLHPYSTQTEPLHCMWKEIDSTNQASNIWDPNARDWCYWDWVGSTATTTCGLPPPGPAEIIVPGTPINIRSYGSL